MLAVYLSWRQTKHPGTCLASTRSPRKAAAGLFRMVDGQRRKLLWKYSLPLKEASGAENCRCEVKRLREDRVLVISTCAAVCNAAARTGAKILLASEGDDTLLCKNVCAALGLSPRARHAAPDALLPHLVVLHLSGSCDSTLEVLLEALDEDHNSNKVYLLLLLGSVLQSPSLATSAHLPPHLRPLRPSQSSETPGAVDQATISRHLLTIHRCHGRVRIDSVNMACAAAVAQTGGRATISSSDVCRELCFVLGAGKKFGS